jgi:MinD superfamily P-loop ATPase
MEDALQGVSGKVGGSGLKQITVISGKGGTGKTSLTACFAALSEGAVFADCDVDASNLHLLLSPTVKETTEFKGLMLASINPDKCIGCGLCEKSCRFGAIEGNRVDALKCEGCRVCSLVCPVSAIEFTESLCGYAYSSETRFGPLSHARLLPGMENSGKLVTIVRKNAQSIAEATGGGLVIVDGSPGIGCPVIASLSNVDACLIVTEPTPSGRYDMIRALQLARYFEIKPLVCVNKYDLSVENTEGIRDYCSEEGARFVGVVPFDPSFTEAMVRGITLIEYKGESETVKAIKKIWGLLVEELDVP